MLRHSHIRPSWRGTATSEAHSAPNKRFQVQQAVVRFYVFCFKNKTKQKGHILQVCSSIPKTLKPTPKHSEVLFPEVSLCSSRPQWRIQTCLVACAGSWGKPSRAKKGPSMSAVVQPPCDLQMGSYRAKGTCQIRSVLSVSLHGAGRPLRPPGALPKWR